MIVFRWVIGSVAALLLLSMFFSYGLGLAFGASVWMERGKHFRHWIWVLALVWFNIEIWGRVGWTLVTWNR